MATWRKDQPHCEAKKNHLWLSNGKIFWIMPMAMLVRVSWNILSYMPVLEGLTSYWNYDAYMQWNYMTIKTVSVELYIKN